MKTIIFFILFILVCVSIFSQNITNTLGTSGVFTIKDGSTNYMTLNQSTGQVNLLRTLRLENTTNSTTGVIYKGTERFLHNYGTANTFIGLSSGNFSMTGISNTAVGLFSLISNATGNNNSAFGYLSLRFNTTGESSSAFGYNSLSSNSTGFHNSAFGYNSLSSNSTGESNSGFGYGSLESNTTGFFNSAFGKYSLNNNTTGDFNSAFGNYSLFNNTTSGRNSAFGYQSLLNNNIGDRNSAFGYFSLHLNTTGINNSAFGYQSLSNNTGGSHNSAFGYNSLSSNLTGDFNSALGFSAGSIITIGTNLTLIGYDAEPSAGSADNQITLGNGSVTSLRCNVTTITSLSDARDKKNITDLSLGLDFIVKLKPRLFNWDRREWYDDNKSDGTKMQETPTAGFIAQELDEVQTTENAEWLNLVLKDNPEKFEATPGNLLPIMVKAIQELKAENDKLKERLTKLEQLVNNQDNLISVINE